jgi:hypothetical protein
MVKPRNASSDNKRLTEGRSELDTGNDTPDDDDNAEEEFINLIGKILLVQIARAEMR